MLPVAEDEREVFERRYGRFRAVDTSSDADAILGAFGDGKSDVRFRITYSGELKASGKKPRLDEKEAIRTFISPQLAELSNLHPVFAGRALTTERRWVHAPQNVGRSLDLLSSSFRTEAERVIVQPDLRVRFDLTGC